MVLPWYLHGTLRKKHGACAKAFLYKKCINQKPKYVMDNHNHDAYLTECQITAMIQNTLLYQGTCNNMVITRFNEIQAVHKTPVSTHTDLLITSQGQIE